MVEAAIEIKELRKVFSKGRDKVIAVDDLSLVIERGEIFGLLGPNGAGKTTTVEICEGLQDPTSGDVAILGSRWKAGGRDATAIRQRIGVTLQDTRFFEKQSVREVLTLFRSFYEHGRTVDEVMGMFSLEEKARTRTTHLSGGQRQRLAVACAMVSDPELLFLDEPTTGLDPQARRQLWDAIRDYQAGGGTVLLTTHYMEEAESLCGRVGIVDRGRIIALGTPTELIATTGGAHIVEANIEGISSAISSEELALLPGVEAHTLTEDQLVLTVAAPHLVVPGLINLLAQKGMSMDGLATRHASLEDVFMNLTGRHLRDGESS
ncbi:MAG: ABC transporter ATP-binding protein [Planctomycetota bacterium]|nr:ABC transporter ATP-binding protein [Planctomycetota bacterium]